MTKNTASGATSNLFFQTICGKLKEFKNIENKRYLVELIQPPTRPAASRMTIYGRNKRAHCIKLNQKVKRTRGGTFCAIGFFYEAGTLESTSSILIYSQSMR
jgi:hypothetical protein